LVFFRSLNCHQFMLQFRQNTAVIYIHRTCKTSSFISNPTCKGLAFPNTVRIDLFGRKWIWSFLALQFQFNMANEGATSLNRAERITKKSESFLLLTGGGPNDTEDRT